MEMTRPHRIRRLSEYQTGYTCTTAEDGSVSCKRTDTAFDISDSPNRKLVSCEEIPAMIGNTFRPKYCTKYGCVQKNDTDRFCSSGSYVQFKTEYVCNNGGRFEFIEDI
jgi:hypothetical protein